MRQTRVVPFALAALCLWGCTPPDSEGPPKKKTGSTDSGITLTGTPTTTDTGTVTTTPIDCENIPDTPISVQQLNIETTEDFDFDTEGNMVFAQWLGTALIAVDYSLNFSLISGGIQDTRGISVLEDGRIIIAYIGAGTVGIIDPTTGSNTNLITGLSGPNALEVSVDNKIYFTETGGNARVREFDYVTGTSAPVATGFSYPNGLVINETHDVLYVSDSTTGIYEVHKNPDGTWGDKEILYDPPGSYDGMEIDACGNLYVLSFNTGKIVRFDPRIRPLEPVVIAELFDPQAFLWNAMHWGSDRGGWRRDTLYVTDRNIVFALEMGVPGKAQPIDLHP